MSEYVQEKKKISVVKNMWFSSALILIFPVCTFLFTFHVEWVAKYLPKINVKIASGTIVMNTHANVFVVEWIVPFCCQQWKQNPVVDLINLY